MGVRRNIERHETLVCQEEGLRAALLLEQAALCLLRVAPPALRKFAFHMVLAGLRYSSCGQSALGARAYRCGCSGISLANVFWGMGYKHGVRLAGLR